MEIRKEKIIQEKIAAAAKAVEYIENGMTIGLGTGSTVKFLLDSIAKKTENGLEVTAVSTSSQTTGIAESLGIKIMKLNDVDKIDLTIDGADEVDLNLIGIKGGGGALLYEKIVASISEKNIWIVDSTKLANRLGKFPLPVEVVPFGSEHIFKTLNSRGFNPRFRMQGGSYFITDGNHYIIDLQLGVIQNISSLNNELLSITGIVETGLFINICDVLIVGEDNHCKILTKKRPAF
jgi:ribose 5-phosphate isomerase A